MNYEAECHLYSSDWLLRTSDGPGEFSYTLKEPPTSLTGASGPIRSLLKKMLYLSSNPSIKKNVSIF